MRTSDALLSHARHLPGFRQNSENPNSPEIAKFTFCWNFQGGVRAAAFELLCLDVRTKV